MRGNALNGALLLLIPFASSSCSDCCSSGGSCSEAWKGEKGVCCGGGQCCPIGSYCYRCGGAWRCSWSRNPSCHSSSSYTTSEGFWGQCIFLAFLFLAFVIIARACVSSMYPSSLPWQSSSHTSHSLHSAQSQSVQQPLVLPGYPVQNSGMSAAGGAAVGFVAGSLLSDAMHSSPCYSIEPSQEGGFEADE